MFSALQLIGRQKWLPKDKGYHPIVVSQYILDSMGSTSPYWHLSYQRGGITQPSMRTIVTRFYNAGKRLYPRLLDVVH